MSSRAGKRKRYSDIKNMLVNDLHKLTIDSGDFNNDLLVANEDFVLMFKSMEDRENVLMSRSLLIAEKYGEITALVKEGKYSNVGESSSTNVQLPSAYAEDIRKFVNDSSTSLSGHAKVFKEQVQEMNVIFKKYAEIWERKNNEMKEHAAKIEEEERKLANQLSDLMRAV